ncbi:MAG: WD40 repeat domain-containing protein [Verrucomicrobiota bacterium]
MQTAFTPGTLQSHVFPFGAVTTAAFSPDSKLLALGGIVDPRLTAVLPPNGLSDDFGEPAVVQELFGQTKKSSTRVLIWDTSSGTLLTHVGRSRTYPIVFSPDGNWLAIPAPGARTRLWNVRKREWSLTLAGSGVPSFSSDTKAVGLLNTNGYVAYSLPRGEKLSQGDSTNRIGFGASVNLLLPEGVLSVLTNQSQYAPSFRNFSQNGKALMWGSTNEANFLHVAVLNNSSMKRLMEVNVGDGMLAEYLLDSEQGDWKRQLEQRTFSGISDGASVMGMTIVPFQSRRNNQLPLHVISSNQFLASGLAVYPSLRATFLGMDDIFTTVSFPFTGETTSIKNHEFVALSPNGRMLVTQCNGRIRSLKTIQGSKDVDLYGVNAMITIREVIPPPPQLSINRPVTFLEVDSSDNLLATDGFQGVLSKTDGRLHLDRLISESSARFGPGPTQTVWRASMVTIGAGHFKIGLAYSNQVLTELEIPLRKGAGGLNVSPAWNYIVYFDWDEDPKTPVPGHFFQPHTEVRCHLFDLKRGHDSILFTQPFESDLEMNRYPTAFSADGKFLAIGRNIVGQKPREEIWDIVEKKVVSTCKRSMPTIYAAENFAFTSDGKRLAVRTTGPGLNIFTITVFDVKTGQILASCLPVSVPAKAEDSIGGMDFESAVVFNPMVLSPDGALIASAQAARIWIWNSQTGKALICWDAHGDHVTALQFSSDGSTLISGSRIGEIKFWDIPFLRQELKKLNLDW